jgi:Zn-dependent protease
MSESFGWSLSLGRWGRTQIRVHVLFIVAAVLIVHLAVGESEQGGAAHGVLAVAVLFASVLAHELGHALAAARVGGSAEAIVLGPLGGLGTIDAPREPHAELIAILAGPLVNLAILLMALPALYFTGIGIPALLAPLAPAGLVEGPWWMVTLKLAFWTNWLLLIANLLPAFPLDGARMLRAVLWPALDYRGACLVAIRASKLAAVGLCVWAWLARDGQSAATLPSWLPLVMLAIFVYFSARQEASRSDEAEWEEEMFSYDFSQGYTSLERSSQPRPRPVGAVERWLNNRRELRRRRRESQERDEERQVDSILIRLNETGLKGLTAKERALLNRVSARYRNRQGN